MPTPLNISIKIQDAGDMTFDELKDALTESLADNGIDTDADSDNVEITNDATTGDPNEMEDTPDEPEAPAPNPMPGTTSTPPGTPPTK